MLTFSCRSVWWPLRSKDGRHKCSFHLQTKILDVWLAQDLKSSPTSDINNSLRLHRSALRKNAFWITVTSTQPSFFWVSYMYDLYSMMILFPLNLWKMMLSGDRKLYSAGRNSIVRVRIKHCLNLSLQANRYAGHNTDLMWFFSYWY